MDKTASRRRTKILELVSSQSICTQNDLLNALREAGFDVTQPTVSRDVRSLRLTKERNGKGERCYAVPKRVPDEPPDARIRIFQDVVVSINQSGSLVIIRTLNGSANAAAEVIDRLSFPEVLGTIAGDNTIFVAATSQETAAAAAARFSDLLSGTDAFQL